MNLLSRLSVVERGLLLCTSMNRGIIKFRNAKLVRQLRIIMARLTALISCARKLRILAQYARKRRWKETKPENMITLDHASPYFGYVAPHIGIGAAGLSGDAFEIYQRLKNGALPHSLLGQLNIHLYVSC